LCGANGVGRRRHRHLLSVVIIVRRAIAVAVIVRRTVAVAIFVNVIVCCAITVVVVVVRRTITLVVDAIVQRTLTEKEAKTSSLIVLFSHEG